MKRLVFQLSILLPQLLCFFCGQVLGQEPPVKLWPTNPPAETLQLGSERTLPARDKQGASIERLTDVSEPTLTLYRPENPDPHNTAVIVAPGGGYNLLAYSHEGTEICQWLNSLGVTAVLLKYRVPRRHGNQVVQEVPLLDASRAVRMVRTKAEQWGIEPTRIGMLGFSAGGHLAVMTASRGDRAVADPIDAIDQVSSALDFVIPIYPAYLLNPETGQLHESIEVSEDFPPAFIAITYDDAERAVGAAMLLAAMKRVSVPCELHVYRSGGHGYGMRATGFPVANWPHLCRDWLVASGLLSQGE